MLFNTANLTYWIFLGIGVFLFLVVILTGGGEDQDVDTDVDTDVDLDGDVDNEVDSHVSADLDSDNDIDFLVLLSWFGVGKSPLLILLAIDFSTWGVSGWFLNVLVGGFINGIPDGFIAGLIFFISFVFSLYIGRLTSYPIGKIFANFGENMEGDRLIGCTGIVTSKQIPYLIHGRIGQADVIDSAGNLVTIEVCLPDWAKVIPHRQQEIVIIDRQNNCYIAVAKDTSDQDKWLNSSNN